jgi:serine/threonine protein kinase
MKPAWWERVKKMLRTLVPGRSGRSAEPPPTTTPTPTQSVTQTDSASAGALEGAATVAIVRPPSRVRKTVRSLARGQTVAERFRVLRFVNSGGMGEVFEAWDSELGERVALKTIRPEIGYLSAVIERFKQEVRQSRGISHINVCRVYEVFSHAQASGERIWFLTMELLEGETLAERIRQQGPVPPRQALGLVEQMVAGLAAAHELGVVHRDFKSSNVMLVETSLGKTRAVVTDFGLSLKLLTGQHIDPEEFRQGTPRYMAPEQAQGLDVSFATDQYSLGVVMCEMLTGKSPLSPEPTSRAVLPEGHDLSPRWESVIHRCLEYHPEDRFPDIRDVAHALSPVRRSKTAWAMGAVVLVAVGLAGYSVLMRGDRGDRVENVTQVTPDTDLTSRPSLSRDGSMIAYSSDRAESGNMDIWVQHLPSGQPIRLTTNPAEDVDPNLAPDGSAVVFRSERDGGGIYIINVKDGGERLLARYGRNPRFSPDGRSVAYWVGNRDDTVASGQIFVQSLVDGASNRLASDFKDARTPIWSSDARHILFEGCYGGEQPMPACSQWWVMDRDGRNARDTGGFDHLRTAHIILMDLIGGWYGDKVLFGGRQEATTSLWELMLPQSTLRAEGKPRQLTSGEAREVAPSLAENGTIAFEHLTAALHIWCIDHAAEPGKAVATKATHDPTVDITPSVSSDGHWLVFARGYGSKRNIWIKNMQSGTEAMIPTVDGAKFSPLIDNAGENIVFEGRENNVPALLALTRNKPVRLLRTGCANPTGWFDGNRAVFCREGVPSRIEMVDVATAATTTVLTKKDYSLGEATWSPTSQYLLFTATRDGVTKQIFAVRFPQSAQMPVGAWIPVTAKTEFSDWPRWSGDGKTIFYVSRRDSFSCLWANRFDPESGHVIGTPFPVFHYHNPRFSPSVVAESSFNLSGSRDQIYLNIGEINTSVWVGRMKHPGFLSWLWPSP